MKKNFTYFGIFRIIGLFLLIILVFVAFRKSSSSVKNVVWESSTEALKETAEFYARTFEIKINDQLSMLESQCRYFSDIDMTDYSLLKKTIMSTRGIGEFKRIAVANKEGMTVNYHGSTSGNIYLAEYFRSAIKERKPKISKNIITDEDGEDVLVLAVPIIQDHQPVGVITGTFSYSILGSLFSVSSFNGLGYSEIASKDGQIIVSNKFTPYANQNLFVSIAEFEDAEETIERVRSDMEKNLSGFFTKKTSGSEELVYYTPVGVNDWYVFSYVKATYVKQMQRKISISTYSLIAVLLLVVVVICIMFFHFQKETADALSDVEKFAIANEQNRSCVFEYDLRSRKIKFSGNYEYVLGKIKNPIDLLSLRALYINIHEDDRNVMSHVDEFFSDNQDTFTSELRFKCTDGEYSWFKLTGTAVKDKLTNKIEKFVGNFTNVNAQILHEQELRYIAETDLLSGLLNKSFFQKKVVHSITKTEEGATGALFVIDLDNFKKTNDTLGHSMGDIAIRDASQKISLIFSQKDIIGRIGGDEFCVFMRLDNVNENVAAKIIMDKAASLNDSLQEYYNNDVSSVKVSASVGIALWPQHAATFNELFRCADAALYYVKRHGKDGNVIYSEKMKNGEEVTYD